uniref:Uncharacterized protein n=1 Tax=Anguilla anguilla TaxID=7936 RepID=A0A0E9X6S1_ANGAN
MKPKKSQFQNTNAPCQILTETVHFFRRSILSIFCITAGIQYGRLLGVILYLVSRGTYITNAVHHSKGTQELGF